MGRGDNVPYKNDPAPRSETTLATEQNTSDTKGADTDADHEKRQVGPWSGRGGVSE